MMENLINKLNEATVAYDMGNPIMSDYEWDQLYFELVQKEKEVGYSLPNSPTQKIHYEVVNNLEKIEHEHKLLSLAKTKDWDEFKNYFNPKEEVITMLKLDGLTVSLTYEKGRLVRAETRGNGLVGENILHNAKVIPSIPKIIPYRDRLVIDGEVICMAEDFAEFANDYKNPRNFAAGSIRLLDAKECARRKLTFVAWYIAEGFDGEKLTDKFKQASKCGFHLVPYINGFENKELLQTAAKQYGYPIDGLVARYNNIEYGLSLGETSHHPNCAQAFKFYDEVVWTILEDIEWTIGRTGQLTPTAVFTPVDHEGSTISRASLHNIDILYSTLGPTPHKGQAVGVAKMNEIIPQIVEADVDAPDDDVEIFAVPALCPLCGKPTAVKEDGNSRFLYCGNANCQGKFINILDHFAGKKGLDIKGLSKATLEKLINWGWVENLSDLFSLGNYERDWKKKPGFGIVSVDKILSAIESAKTTELHQFIAALGIPLIGSTYSKEICKKIDTWEKFRELVEAQFKFTQWNGFGYEMQQALYQFDYSEADKIAKLFTFTNSLFGDDKKKVEGPFTVVITGKLALHKNRDELVHRIEEIGGKVASSVSSKTNYLINNDTNSTSSKNAAAKKHGVEIISEKDFVEKFLI